MRIGGDRLDLRTDVADRLPPPLRMFLQAAAQQVVQARIQIRRERLEARLAHQHRRHHVWHCFALKRLAARQHFVEHDAEREHVAPLIGRKPFRLLRRHVGRRPEDQARLGRHHAQRRRVRQRSGGSGDGSRQTVATGSRPGGLLERLGEPEVEHLHLLVRRDLHVGRLQIAMDDPFLVRRLERLGDLQRDLQRLADRDRAALQPLGQGLTFDQLHDQKVTAVRFLHAVERGDVWVIERGERLGFPLEPRDAIGVRRERVRQDLHCDRAPQFRVACTVDFAHPAYAQRRDDFVEPDPGSG
jgi:hypothetical protein